MRNQPKKTSGNQQRYDHGREGNCGQIHDVVIQLAGPLPAISHWNSQFKGR
jgi:hypothetical protein